MYLNDVKKEEWIKRGENTEYMNKDGKKKGGGEMVWNKWRQWAQLNGRFKTVISAFKCFSV